MNPGSPERTPDACGVKFTGYSGRSVFVCVLPKGHTGDHDDHPTRGNFEAAPLPAEGVTPKFEYKIPSCESGSITVGNTTEKGADSQLVANERSTSRVSAPENSAVNVPLDLTAFVVQLPAKAAVELMGRVIKYGKKCFELGREACGSTPESEPERPILDYVRMAEGHLRDYFLLSQARQKNSKVDAALSVISQALREYDAKLAAPECVSAPTSETCPTCGSKDPKVRFVAHFAGMPVEECRDEFHAVESSPSAEAKSYFGKDCPKGMVQVEFVGAGGPANKYSEYGWKPCEHAFLEVYVDGDRYRIEVGDFHDGVAERRGLHVIGPIDLKVEQTSINAGSMFALRRASTKEGL